MAVELAPSTVRDYIRDSVDVNYLLEDETQFSDSRINLAIEMSLDELNMTPPVSNYTSLAALPRFTRTIILMGTLRHLFQGEAGMAARNQFSYSDGGLTVPLEERFQYWLTLAQHYKASFDQMVKQWKIAANMDGALNGNSSWGEVRSDYSKFPQW